MSKKVLGIIISVVVLLGVGGTGAYLYMTNTPKNKYLLSEKASYEALDTYFSKRFKEEIKLQNDLADSSYNAEVSLNAQAPESLLEGFGIPASMLDSSKLEFNIAHDPAKKNSKIAINPVFNDEEIGAISWSANKDYQFIQAPILEDALKIKNSEIIKGFEKLTGEKVIKEDGLTNETLNLNTIMGSSVDKEQTDEVMQHYFKFILEEIDADNFEKGSDTVTVLGEKQKLDSVTLNLTKADVKKLVLATLDEVKNDKDLQNIVKKSDATIDYKKEVAELIKDAKEAKDYPAIKSTIFVDGKDIQKREMVITSGEDKFNISMDTKINDEIAMKIVAGTPEEREALVLEGSSKGQGQVKDDYKLTIVDMPVVKLTNDEKLDGEERTNTIKLNIIGDNKDEDFEVKYNQKMTTSNNKQTSKGSVVFDLDGEELQLNIDTKTVLKEGFEVKIPNAIDVGEMSESDVEKLGETVSNNLMSLIYGQSEDFE